MREVKGVLRDEFGKIEHVNKIRGGQHTFTFGVGFRYDLDAFEFVKCPGTIESKINNTKLLAKPTPVFEICMGQI